MHHPTDRIIHTTAFVKPVVEHWLEREIAQLVHPMKDRPDDASHHERTLLPRSYISLYTHCVLQKSKYRGAYSVRVSIFEKKPTDNIHLRVKDNIVKRKNE